jgi:Sigma-70 region 3
MLCIQEGCAPTNEEIARRVGITTQKLTKVLWYGRDPISLNDRTTWYGEDVTYQVFCLAQTEYYHVILYWYLLFVGTKHVNWFWFLAERWSRSWNNPLKLQNMVLKLYTSAPSDVNLLRPLKVTKNSKIKCGSWYLVSSLILLSMPTLLFMLTTLWYATYFVLYFVIQVKWVII